MTTATTVMPTRDVTIGDTFVRISGQGFPLVFVHGFTTTSEFWREQAEEFSKSYRVIRINLPGHGASPAPTSRSYCIEDFVEDVARVFRELSIEKAVLIGLSMGGIVAQKFALKYGHLLKALVLADTTLRRTGKPMIADRQWRWRCANSAWRCAVRSTCRTAGSPFPLLVAPTSSIRLGKSLR